MCNTCNIAYKEYAKIHYPILEEYIRQDAIADKIYRDLIKDVKYENKTREALLEYGLATQKNYREYVEARNPHSAAYTKIIQHCNDKTCTRWSLSY